MPSLADRCGVCDTELAFSLPVCPICKKPVCETCAFRMGGSVFCGSTCANSFFFGGQEDVEDESDLHLLDDGE